MKLKKIKDIPKFERIYQELFNKVGVTVKNGDYFSMTDELRGRYIQELYKLAEYDEIYLKVAVRKLANETHLSSSDQFRNILIRCEMR